MKNYNNKFLFLIVLFLLIFIPCIVNADEIIQYDYSNFMINQTCNSFYDLNGNISYSSYNTTCINNDYKRIFQSTDYKFYCNRNDFQNSYLILYDNYFNITRTIRLIGNEIIFTTNDNEYYIRTTYNAVLSGDIKLVRLQYDNNFQKITDQYNVLVSHFIGDLPKEYKWIETIGLISIAFILLSNLWRLYDSKSF